MAKLNWNTMKQTLNLNEVEDALGVTVLTCHHDEDVARCPLPSHKGVDSNPSFAINRNRLVFNCFTCGVGGSIPQLVMEIEGLEWEDALEWLRPFVSSLTREDPTAFLQQIKRTLYYDEEQGPEAMPYFKESILTPWKDGPFDYYEGRGIPEKICRALTLCYATEYTKFNPKTRTEWVGEAAIIPHFFGGHLVGYQARITGDKPLGLPRYDNTSNFPKVDTLYNYGMACDHTGPVYVVESALTVAYILSLGGMAVSTFGATVSREQINLLRVFPNLVLAFDNDTPGIQATGKVMDALKKHVNVRIMVKVEGAKSDLLDLPRDQASEHMKLTFPASLYSYYTD